MSQKCTNSAAGKRPLSKIKAESREDYLKAIYVFSGMGTNVIRSYELADYMGLSKASVCRMVGILREADLLNMDRNFNIRLTSEGLTEARRIYLKYRFFQDLLVKAGIALEQAEEEACRLEHMLSEDSFRKLQAYCAGQPAQISTEN